MYHKYKNVERVKPSGLELQDHLVGVQRVTKVTKGGRAFGFSAIVVVGDGNGVVGQGFRRERLSSTSGRDSRAWLLARPIADRAGSRHARRSSQR